MSPGQQPLVLIVDDEPLVRMIAAEGLFDAGFEVIEAESAEDALGILAARPDIGVLFTDINMPGGVDGVELANLVHARWPRLCIVITSGQDHLRAGAMPQAGRFVPKPYRADDVVHVIGQMIG